ncbi:MAG: Tfp pilus assembly protein FimT/FimU [Deltaproteobacteria bacterium]
MSAPGKPDSISCRGFSLLELLLVMALAGMLAALVVPSLTGTLESARLRGSAGEVRAALTLARTLAVSEARGRFVDFDLGKGEYGVSGDARKWLLPDGISLSSIRLGSAEAERGIVRIRFYPDGSADEAEVAISSAAGGSRRVSVDPLTGISTEGT